MDFEAEHDLKQSGFEPTDVAIKIQQAGWPVFADDAFKIEFPAIWVSTCLLHFSLATVKSTFQVLKWSEGIRLQERLESPEASHLFAKVQLLHIQGSIIRDLIGKRQVHWLAF